MARELWIEHVTVVSPERSAPLRDVTVVIRDERISSILASDSPRDSGSDVEIIDGTDLFVSPGLIDSHVHTSELAGMVGSMEEQFPVVARALREQLPRSATRLDTHPIVHANGWMSNRALEPSLRIVSIN